MSTATAEKKGNVVEAGARFAKDQLKSVVERIEHLEGEKKALSDDIREVLAEAKGQGFDVKAVRAIIRLRKMDKTDVRAIIQLRKIDKTERAEQDAVLETYMHALGMA